ncbi:RNA dependent RNA polymerase-domain-containing protein [Podospora conica]|nr:RNA dependent RNA polymerase-domain-containing protein [Schizothecium conicum]
MRAMPLGRSVAATAALRGPCIAGRQRFTTSLLRRAVAGGHHEPRVASVWSLSNVCAVAITAGLMGWGASEFRHGGFPGTMLLDGGPDTPRYASMREMEQVRWLTNSQALEEIRQELVNPDCISTDPEDLHAHGYSEWSTVNPEGLPVAVAYPRSTEQVAAIARVCHKYRIPIIPYSGGSSLEGNFSAPFGGISIDFAYMDKIVQFNKEDMDIVVQPSIGWQDLNEQLAKMGSGLFFPIDPGPSAKVGGMIGTNCSGTNAVKYGTMKDWVINLTVVLADGTVIKTRRRPRKSSAGYNLNGLFVGSEGTLGLVTEATLKLSVIPEEFSVAVVTFPSIRDAASAAAEVMQTGIPVAAMEIMDEVQMKVVNMGGATAPRVWKELPTLFFKFSGTKAGVKENISLVQRITKANKGGNFEFAKDEREQKLLWSARKESLWSMLALRKDGDEVWSTDVAVPFSRLADIIEVSKKEMDELGLFASILGHIGDGNFHESIIYNRQVKGEREKVEMCVKNMVKRALEMEGTCTGEHSIGWGKKESLLWEVGPDTLGVMKSIKAALDPRWIMGLFSAPPISATSKPPPPHHHTTTTKPFLRMVPHSSAPPAESQRGRSLTMVLRFIPQHTTARDIYTSFERYGNVVYIDLDESKPRRARVRFEPFPDLGFFNHGQTEIWTGCGYIKVHVEFTAPRGNGNGNLKTPLGNPCPGYVKLPLRGLTFGVLESPTSVIGKRSFEAPSSSFLLDFENRKMVVYFDVTHNVSGKERPAFVSRHYRAEISFSNLDKLYRVACGSKSGLVITVRDPPRFSRKRSSADDSFKANQLIWGDHELYQRAVDIKHGVRLAEHPVSLDELESDSQIVDIGRWTTYWLHLDIKEYEALSTIKPILRDWNIKVSETSGFALLPSREPELWPILTEHSELGSWSQYLGAMESHLPFDVRYQLEVCISQGILKLFELSKIEVMGFRRARLVLEYAADHGRRIFNPMSLIKNKAALEYLPATVNLPAHCTLVRKVTITPTRIVYSTPTVETTNRILRKYKDHHEHFIRRIQGCNDVLKAGIRMGHVHWKFLAYGNSQVRENGAFFFNEAAREGLTCEKIRQRMGQLGIAVKIVRIQDKERGGHCFTDGVGKISPFMAKMVADDWKLPSPPSAIQFRMAGCKGVLVTWPGVKGTEVHVRKSQEKFEAEFNGLEVIRCSQYACATLNRQTIPVLSSLGEQISNYDAAMEDPAKATDLLGRYVDENQITLVIKDMVTNGFMNEPFVHTLLHLWRSWSLKLLKEKTRLIVEQSAFVLGCVDETDTLRGHKRSIEGLRKVPISELPQIFLQISDPESETKFRVVTGVCIVGRNPSLHPGDIRVVEAVDVPALRHLKNVVVFPLGGDRDVPGMCSGGDLDGDDFFVIWDKRLLPEPTEWGCVPMDYTPPKPRKEEGGVTEGGLMAFFTDFMKNNTLPLIAHAHMGFADLDPRGPKSKKCLELAQKHSMAVDYVKTGVPAPWDKKRDEPPHWPHYMEKRGGKTRHSASALGKLYDLVKKEAFDELEGYNLPFDKRIMERFSNNLDPSLLKRARKIKCQYDTAIRRVMAQHEIGTEFEIWTGFVMSTPRVGTSYKLQEKLGQEANALKKHFRDVCIQEAGSRDSEVLGPFVAAMYQITCEEVDIARHESRQPHALPNGKFGFGLGQLSGRTRPLISFPWLFSEMLGELAGGSAARRRGVNAGLHIANVPRESAGAAGSAEADGTFQQQGTFQQKADIEEMYTRTEDGQVIHRGEILNLFHHGESDEEDEEDEDGEDEGDEDDQDESNPKQQTLPLVKSVISGFGSYSEELSLLDLGTIAKVPTSTPGMIPQTLSLSTETGAHNEPSLTDTAEDSSSYVTTAPTTSLADTSDSEMEFEQDFLELPGESALEKAARLFQ